MATEDDDDRALPANPNPPPSPGPVAVVPDEAMLPNMLPVPGGGGKVNCCCSPEPGITSRYGM